MNSCRVVPILLLLLLASCSPHPTDKTLSNHQFARVFAALTKKSVSVHSPGYDTVAARRTADSLLLAAGVTREEMIATVRRINATPSQWKDVMDEVTVAIRDTSLH